MAKTHGYPFHFTTMVSINIVDDPEMMQLLKESRLTSLFIGVEAFDEQILREMKKLQNTKRSLVKGLRALASHGVTVVGGIILGHDGETAATVRETAKFIDASLIFESLSLLSAHPGTALYTRLKKEGRLLWEDDSPGDALGGPIEGMNFIPSRSRLSILKDLRFLYVRQLSSWRYFTKIFKAVILFRDPTSTSFTVEKKVISSSYKKLKKLGVLMSGLLKECPIATLPFLALLSYLLLFKRQRIAAALSWSMNFPTQRRDAKQAVKEVDAAIAFLNSKKAPKSLALTTANMNYKVLPDKTKSPALLNRDVSLNNFPDTLGI